MTEASNVPDQATAGSKTEPIFETSTEAAPQLDRQNPALSWVEKLESSGSETHQPSGSQNGRSVPEAGEISQDPRATGETLDPVIEVSDRK